MAHNHTWLNSYVYLLLVVIDCRLVTLNSSNQVSGTLPAALIYHTAISILSTQSLLECGVCH